MRLRRSRLFVLGSVLIALVASTAIAVIAEPDEAALRASVEQLYSSYAGNVTQQDSGATIENSVSLADLLARWDEISADGEVNEMNSFDWYCQCQDFDFETAKLVSQTFVRKSDGRIENRVLYSTGWSGPAEPLTFVFVMEGGEWKLDDLIFAVGNTLRTGLQGDLEAAVN